MGDSDKSKSALLRSLILTASLGGLAVAGCTNTGPTAREAVVTSGNQCSAAVRSNSASAVNTVLRRSPTDPCIPAMLSALPKNVLARVNRRLVEQLPTAQRNAIPRSVLAQIGQPISAKASVVDRSTKQDRQY